MTDKNGATGAQIDLTDEQIDDIARLFAGIGGIEDYRAFARALARAGQQASNEAFTAAHRDLKGEGFFAPVRNLTDAEHAALGINPWATRTSQQAGSDAGLIEAGALRQYQHNDGSDLVSAYDKTIVDREFARLRAQLASAQRWSKEPPTEQGDYWHWNGDEDHAPMIYHVMWSGTAKKCFLSIGQYYITTAIWCDKFGGWWMPIEQPRTPDLAQITNTTGK